jgi:sugar-phosphatase
MAAKKRGQSSIPSTLGGIVVGFEYDVWRRQPPPHELVRKGQPVRGLAADGTDLTVELPDASIHSPRTAAWPSPRAVFLDLDGLAVDSEPIHHESTKRALAAFGLEFDPALIDPYYGQPTSVSTRAIAALHGIDAEALIARRTSEFDRLVDAGVPFRPGLVDACAALDRAGIRLGLVSSGLRRYVERAAAAMRAAGIRLEVVLSSEDVVQAKPHPEPYLTAARALGVEPAASVVFEDAVAGVRSAVDAGMRCVVVPNEHTSGGDFGGASAIVPGLVEAAAWVLRQVRAEA